MGWVGRNLLYLISSYRILHLPLPGSLPYICVCYLCYRYGLSTNSFHLLPVWNGPEPMSLQGRRSDHWLWSGGYIGCESPLLRGPLGEFINVL
jgi:hypothetical protein